MFTEDKPVPPKQEEQNESKEHKDSQSQRSGRHKRSVSEERQVEVLVVTDSVMNAFHGKDLQTYILTLMSIVSFFNLIRLF